MEVTTFLHYLEYQKRYSKHTLLAYHTDLSQFAEFLAKEFDTNLIDADYNHVRTWIIRLMDTQHDASSVHRKLASLKSYYKFSQKNGAIKTNPTSRIKPPKRKKRLPVFVEETSMDVLFDEIAFDNDFKGTRDRLVLEILYGTGIRLSELISLKIRDVDLHNAQIKVLGKGNKERVIPIHKNLVKLLEAYNIHLKNTFNSVDTEVLVLTDKGEKAYPVFIQRLVKRYIAMVSPVVKKSPHVLRHSFATHMLNHGADLNSIKDLMGHSSLAATQVYTHNTVEKLKSIFNQAHPKA